MDFGKPKGRLAPHVIHPRTQITGLSALSGKQPAIVADGAYIAQYRDPSSNDFDVKPA
jgi:hypothetical protein